MESLTRLVSESLARHGFDRPLDYRRLSWSRWFRCESPHSLLFVPSKPGVFALAEEITDLGQDVAERPYSATTRVEERRFSATPRVEGRPFSATTPVEERPFSATTPVQERRFSAASGSHSGPALAAGGTSPEAESRKPEAAPRRMLAVTQFFEDDDMAFVLDRMLSHQNPMAARLASGRYFVRFVVIEDQTQRRSICTALNQWMLSAAEKATGIGSHFATSLELTPATEYVPQVDDRQATLFGNNQEQENVGRTLLSATADTTAPHVVTDASPVPRNEASGPSANLGFSASHSTLTAPQLDSGAATNIHCPSPFPSGF